MVLYIDTVKNSNTENIESPLNHVDDALRDIDVQDLLFFDNPKNGQSNTLIQLEDYINDTDSNVEQILLSFYEEKSNPWNDNKKFKRRKNKQCDICNKLFTTKTKLMVHMRVHTMDKPYECTYCNRGFSQKHNLKRHEFTHFEDKQKLYQCQYCGLRYNQSSSLSDHILNKHKKIASVEISCTICKKTLTSKNSFRMHYYFVHKNSQYIYCCQYCSKEFKQLSNLRTHENIHKSEKFNYCTNCKRCFISPSSLSIHKKSCTNMEIECIVCHKLFNTRESWKKHEEIHLNKKK